VVLLVGCTYATGSLVVRSLGCRRGMSPKKPKKVISMKWPYELLRNKNEANQISGEQKDNPNYQRAVYKDSMNGVFWA
jgi:hypothetical protein